jgi:predicted AAA+ superfamily ATPase
LLQYALGNDYTYVTFDDVRLRTLFEDDPERFMQTYAHQVIFDEVQKVPDLFHYIKRAVDQDRMAYGKFVLTGSSQFLMMKNVSESLAGRIGLLSLLPFDHTELPESCRKNAIWQGCYPEPVLRNYQGADDWYAAYLETYITRDVRDVAQIGNLHDFRRLIQLLAAHTTQLLNMSSLASDLGVSVPTIKRWVSILELSYVIFLLQPYHQNFGKRMIKSPKIYFYDTGLVSALTGIQSSEMYERGPMAGSLFENYVVAQCVKQARHTNERSAFYFYRTSHGDEIDLVIENGLQYELVEIKKTATFRPRLIKTLETFSQKAQRATLVYDGEPMLDVGGIHIQNWSAFLLKSNSL